MPFSSILILQARGFLPDKMNAPSSWVKLTRLRLRVGGAIFGQFFQDKIGLRLLNRRAAYAIVGRLKEQLEQFSPKILEYSPKYRDKIINKTQSYQ